MASPAFGHAPGLERPVRHACSATPPVRPRLFGHAPGSARRAFFARFGASCSERRFGAPCSACARLGAPGRPLARLGAPLFGAPGSARRFDTRPVRRAPVRSPVRCAARSTPVSARPCSERRVGHSPGSARRAFDLQPAPAASGLLHLAPVLDGATQRQLIGQLDLAAHRHSHRKTGYGDAHRFYYSR